MLYKKNNNGIFKELKMKKFTFYEAEKFLNEIAEKNELDIDGFDLSEFSNAKEASQTLGVSESTANNWLSRRTDISKLGDQAIAYQLMLNMVKAYKQTPKSNVLVSDNDEYTIYRKKDDGDYEFLAKTSDIKLARTIKEINKVYKSLAFCEEFISEELKTREDYFSEGELQPYNIELTNLRDLIRYISKGVNLSQFIDEQRQEIKDEFNKIFSPITISTNNVKLNKDEVVIALKNKALDDLVNDKKVYYNIFPVGTLFRYKTNKYTRYVKKIANNKYRPEREEVNGIITAQFDTSNWQIYSGASSAFQNTWTSISVPRDTQYSIDNGKNWIDTRKAEMTDEEYDKFILERKTNI